MAHILAVVLTTFVALATDVTGTWAGTLTPDERDPTPAVLVLRREGRTVTGTAGGSDATSLVLERVSGDPDRAHRDFQYGEWLRADLADGWTPQPTEDPDVVLLVAAALSRHRVLLGPALENILPAVSPAHLREAALRVLPDVIQHATGDERNALLTMARIVVTVRTGTIVSKDAAAAAIIPSLPQPDRELMQRARAVYLHGGDRDWTADAEAVREVLLRLATRSRPAPSA